MCHVNRRFASTGLIYSKRPLDTLEYIKLPMTSRVGFVPKPRPEVDIVDVASFLKCIGRDTEQYSSKFETWDRFFKVNLEDEETLGIPRKSLVFIMKMQENYRLGYVPKARPVPKRRHKYYRTKKDYKAYHKLNRRAKEFKGFLYVRRQQSLKSQ